MNLAPDSPVAPARQSPARNAGALLVGQLVARLLALAFYIVFARVVGAERYGDFAVGVAFGTLFAILIEPGLNPQIVREGARDHALRIEYVNAAALYKLTAVPTAGLLLVASGLLLGYRGPALLAIATVGFAVLLSQVEEFIAAVITSFERMQMSALLRILNKVVTALAAGAVALATRSFTWTCIAFAAGSLLSASIGLVAVNRWFVPLRFERRCGLGRKIWVGLPLALSDSMSMATMRLDQALASLLGVSVAAIGGYNAAIKMKEALIAVPIVVMVTYAPVLARVLEQRGEFERTFSRLMHWGLGGTVPIAVGTWVVAGPLLEWLFGVEFAAYGPLMRLVFVAYAATGLYLLLFPLVVARHRYRLQAIAAAAVLVVDLALNLVLLPRLGIAGAAWAMIAASLAGAAVLLTEVARARCLAAPALALARSALAAVPMFLVARWLLPIHVALAIAGGALVYLPLYVVSGGLGPGGRAALLRRLRGTSDDAASPR
ncbi:MAG: oligosaccharide flippase family protein [Deltaproteobacteria bacterium]|nr:oligosaccharide flippase family protein [Deltaproteobacteria bacterium]